MASKLLTPLTDLLREGYSSSYMSRSGIKPRFGKDRIQENRVIELTARIPMDIFLF